MTKVQFRLSLGELYLHMQSKKRFRERTGKVTDFEEEPGSMSLRVFIYADTRGDVFDYESRTRFLTSLTF